MPLRTTGISGLDAQLGGGVPSGTTLLLLAEPGNAIPAFAEQFAGGGLEAGDSALYYQLDRSPQHLRAGILSFVHKPAALKASLKIFDAYTSQFTRRTPPPTGDGAPIAVGRKDLFHSALAETHAMGPGTPYRLVVESLSSIVTRDNEEEVLEFVRNLVFVGSEQGGLHLLSLVKGLHSPSFETHLRHLVGGVLEVGTERKGFGLYSYLLVPKLLGVRDPVRLLLFKETEKGIWLESTKRVF